MKTKLNNQKGSTLSASKGFTIIEVLIVLAIAGLILLIVFLAVPALQRNSRNTQRKNDIGRLGGSATEFVSNNNGTLPTASNAATVTSDAGKIAIAAGKLSQYEFLATPATDGINFIVAAFVSTTNPAHPDNLDQVQLVTQAKCDPAGSGAILGGTARQMVLRYSVENSTDKTNLCTDI
ncbi:MAG: prepilin-type N-terminal cleavage/methylation domain-containing protein [Patescibacteria group bacterium]